MNNVVSETRQTRMKSERSSYQRNIGGHVVTVVRRAEHETSQPLRDAVSRVIEVERALARARALGLQPWYSKHTRQWYVGQALLSHWLARQSD